MMKKLLLVIPFVIAIYTLIYKAPSIRKYMLQNNIFPYERKMLGKRTVNTVDSVCYIAFGTFRKEYRNYNYSYKEEKLKIAVDLNDSVMAAIYVNEFDDVTKVEYVDSRFYNKK